ncbi:MAG: UDP-N-acetylglucosamine 2-epimerase (non-hydrolyzing) [Bacteroidota bacterium]
MQLYFTGMITIVTIIGARPQIIKAAAISRAIAAHYSSRIREIIVHTGQHYDENMSGVFFEELGIPRPDYNLNVGSGSHGIQTAEMIRGIEEILLKEKPNCLLVYGDTNSTLAGAIAASKIHVPIVHVEAGLRSFNKSMPEEINRILCDHCSTLLFSPTSTGLKNLKKEGFASNNKPPYSSDNPKTFHCGDVMYDNSLYFAEVAEKKNKIAENENFILCTIHRDNNTDVPERLQSIFRALIRIISDHQMHVYLPIHPRTAKMLDANLGEALHHIVKNEKRLHLIPPASFLDMIALEKKMQYGHH